MAFLPRTITLLPTAVHADREAAARLEAAAHRDTASGATGGGAALPGLAVLTLSAFEQKLAAEVLEPGARASELTARLLVRKVLREVYPNDAAGYFAPLRRSPGFADHLRGLFGRLARGLVTSAQLAAVLEQGRLGEGRPDGGEPDSDRPGRDRAASRLARKVRELARLYAAYEAHLDRLGRGDPAARRRALVAVLSALEAPPRLLDGVERIVVADRDRWLPSDAELLAAVARFVQVEVHLPAPLPDRERVFALVRRSADALNDAVRRATEPAAPCGAPGSGPSGAGGEAGRADPEPDAAPRRRAGGGEPDRIRAPRLTVACDRPCGGPDTAAPLAALCERLFRPAGAAGPAPLDTGEALRFVEAPGREEEVAAVVREVRRALEAGTPPEEIAIVARDLDRYDRLLAAALERARVPFRFRRGTPLLETPPVRALLALLDLPTRRFDLDGLLGVFGGSYTALAGAWPAGPLPHTPGAASDRPDAGPDGAEPAGLGSSEPRTAARGGSAHPGGVPPAGPPCREGRQPFGGEDGPNGAEPAGPALHGSRRASGGSGAGPNGTESADSPFDASRQTFGGSDTVSGGVRQAEPPLPGSPRTSGRGDAEPAAVTPEQLERVLNEAGLLDGPPAAWAAALEGLAAALEAEGRGPDAAECRAVRAALIPALEAVAALDREASLGEHVSRVEALLAHSGLAERAASGDDRRRRQDAAALAGLREALAALRLAEPELGETVRLTFEAFRELLVAALAERFVAPPGSRPVEAIQVLAAADLAGLRFDLVCLLGLVEGEFPRRVPADPILDEREVEALALALAPHAPFETPAQARAAELFYFYRVLSAARRRLVLSAPAEGERGEPLLASSFLEEVARAVDPEARARHPQGDPLAALRTPPVHVPVGRRPVPARFADCLTVAEAEARLAWLAPGLPQVAAARRREAALEGLDPAALEAALCADPEVALRLEARRAASRLAAARDRFFGEPPGETRSALVGPGTGALESEAARSLLRAVLAPGGEIRLSASALETHARCAYQWFLRYGVHLEPVERPAHDLGLDEAGDLLHQALEQGYRACAEAGLVPIGGPGDPEGRAAEALVLAKAKEVLAGWAGSLRPGVPGPVAEAEAERVRRLVRAFVRDEAARAGEDFVPVAFEHRFGLWRDGRRPDAPPLRVRLGDGLTAVLTGAIDRVDAAPGRLRVVDYKRSSRRDWYDAQLEPAAFGVRSFQMPVYLLAALALYRAEPHRFPAGAAGGPGAGGGPGEPDAASVAATPGANTAAAPGAGGVPVVPGSAGGPAAQSAAGGSAAQGEAGGSAVPAEAGVPGTPAVAGAAAAPDPPDARRATVHAGPAPGTSGDRPVAPEPSATVGEPAACSARHPGAGPAATGPVLLEAAFHLLKKRPDLRRRVLDDPGYFALDPGTRAARRAAGLPTFADQLEARVSGALAGPYEITPDPECGLCPYAAVCRVVTPLPVVLP